MKIETVNRITDIAMFVFIVAVLYAVVTSVFAIMGMLAILMA